MGMLWVGGVTLTGNASTLTVSNIPQTGKSLRIAFSGTTTSVLATPRLKLNGVNATYSTVYGQGYNSGQSGLMAFGYIWQNGGGYQIDIPSYSTVQASGALRYVNAISQGASARFGNTSASMSGGTFNLGTGVNSIQIYNATFKAGTKLDVWVIS